ncbi:MAG: DUF4491 domain-containing protein [Chloroflexi bacterium]|nr:DUF4491 domain-containing protein [Chloroflexota bacterium]MDL1941568.1 DUF4491 family protein [Chloroflexi bacterium CFX2]
MNTFGLWIGIATLFVIGLGFVWVIRGERYFGYLWWPCVMGLGAACVLGSLFLSNNWASALLGAAGASLIWGSTELKEQAVRGELGWYPFREKKINPPFAEVIKKWKAPSL